MMGLITRILLIASLFFNAALYYGWMDLGQYRTYIDKLAKSGQEIIESDQFKNLLTLIQDKFKEAYGEDIAKLEEEVKTKIQEVGEEKAVELVQEKYNKLTEADIQTIADEVIKKEEESKISSETTK
ncbi:MAG: hypothetical protein N4A38_05170 [Candidatus Gracilibacteria bacterium]|nr:hypothetical protein [Candidatus Gracilibacteria bacterium]